jgi:lysozyme
MLNVIADLSHYNAPVDFTAAARGGLLGVVHKATQGLSDVDPTYAERRPQAQAAGLLWGAYHFGTNADGATQARHLLLTVGNLSQVLVILDFEAPATAGDGMSTAQAEAFATTIMAATGRYPGLYSTRDYLAQTGADRSPVLANCWLWLADYNAAPPVAPPAWRTWTMWQYTDGQQGNEPRTVPGIGPCDRDQFNGELPGLHALWGLAPAASATVAEVPTATALPGSPSPA